MLAASFLFGWLALFGSVAFAFGADDRSSNPFPANNRVTIEPRVKPGRSAEPADDLRADLRVDVPLVLIPVFVTTPLGASVPNLSKENFRLFEDNVEQRITHFANEDGPLSVGLLFDTSGSMRNKMRKSLEAAASFFKTANSDDEFFLIEFNERSRLTVPFTADSGEIYARLLHTKPAGRTSLLDAIHMGLSEMKRARNFRKAIVILSDGGDNRSRYTEGETMNAMRESDVQLYAMGIFDPDPVRKRTREEWNGPRLLGALAEESGGRHFPVENLNDLPGVCARIGNELRNQYLLGYSPADTARDGKYRRVKVILVAPEKMPPLRTHHRLGYYSPAP